MRISVILGHPKTGSFNHAIAEAVVDALNQNGHEVTYHNLYAEGFDPIIPASEIPKGSAIDPAIQRHCYEIAAANGIVIVYPNWWGQPPAILKGRVDRVIRPGVAYQFLEGEGERHRTEGAGARLRRMGTLQGNSGTRWGWAGR